MRPFANLKVLSEAENGRFYALNPRTNGVAYLDANPVGPSNYWSSNWGYAGSRGCLGMNYDDSLWFWNWATIGTPIVIHW